MGNVFEAVRIIANNCESGYSNDSGKDYIDRETGFLYCGMCHTTKQTIVDFFGRNGTLHILAIPILMMNSLK